MACSGSPNYGISIAGKLYYRCGGIGMRYEVRKCSHMTLALKTIAGLYHPSQQ